MDVSSFFEEKIFVESSIFTSAFSGAKNQGTNFEFLYIERAEKIIEKFNQEIINERVSNLYDLYDLFEGKNKNFSIYEIKMFSEDFIDVIKKIKSEGTTKTEPVKATVRVNPYSLLFFVLINKFSYLKQNAQNISQSQNIENAVDILTKISEKLI